MLTLTETASTVVKTIVAQNAGVEDAGLRINADDADTTNFGVAISAAPEVDDAIVESDGARVFLDQNAAIALDDKVLDAQVEEDGSVRFAIANQA